MGGRPRDTPAAVATGPDPREHNRRVMSSDIHLCQSSLLSYSVLDFMVLYKIDFKSIACILHTKQIKFFGDSYDLCGSKARFV